MKIDFPEQFWWGAATSGPQSEGRFNKKHANVFDYWFEVEPDAFFDQVGPDVASNFYNSYKEDIALMKEIGMNSFRTSIQWTRLIDDFEEATVNEDAVRFYNAVIDECLLQGIRPVINLFHFDMPIALQENYGGWESKHVVDLYVKFASKCFQLFGDRVTEWFTFNEPLVIVDGAYLYQFHYPKLVDGRKAVQVAYNIALASAKAVKAYRKINTHVDGKIGIILNLTPSYPASDDPADLSAARFADLWMNEMFLDAAVKGQFPKELTDTFQKDGVLWDASEAELCLIAENTIDLLGVNFYHPNRVQRPDISADSLAVDWLPTKYFDGFAMPGRRMNVDKGWEIYPQALYDIALNIRDNYGNIPWFVSENGMGVSKEERYLNKEGIIQDDYRIQFIQEHLYWLAKGMAEGSNCFGFHLWTPIDCWSWMNAYRNRYGFISNNIHTQVKTIKKSGRWFRKVVEENQLEVPDTIVAKWTEQVSKEPMEIVL